MTPQLTERTDDVAYISNLLGTPLTASTYVGQAGQYEGASSSGVLMNGRSSIVDLVLQNCW